MCCLSSLRWVRMFTIFSEKNRNLNAAQKGFLFFLKEFRSCWFAVNRNGKNFIILHFYRTCFILINMFMSALIGVSIKGLEIELFIPVVLCTVVIFLGLDGCTKDAHEGSEKQFFSLQDAEAFSQM